MTTETVSTSAEIEANVDRILSEAGIRYRAALVEKGHKRDEWECDKWTAEFNGNSHFGSFEYFTGTGLRSPQPKPTDGGPKPLPRTLMWEQLEAQRKPVAPKAAGVIHSLLLDASAAETTFEDWCGEFGYDTDSRKALRMYLDSQAAFAKLARCLSYPLIQQLREVTADY